MRTESVEMKRIDSVNWLKLAALIIASWATCTATSQVPGDEDQGCSTPPTFNQETLLDSSNYANLLNGTWTVVDNDNNNDPIGNISTPTVQ